MHIYLKIYFLIKPSKHMAGLHVIRHLKIIYQCNLMKQNKRFYFGLPSTVEKKNTIDSRTKIIVVLV